MPPEAAPAADLRCPVDGGALERLPDALHCRECEATYAVVGGIPDFVTHAAARTARWDAAQRYELAYWRQRGRGALVRDPERWRAAAAALADRFDEVAGGDWRARVLQIGPAGVGEIHHLPARERWAVEPLAIPLDRAGLLARGDVHFVASMGEALPFADAWFSAAIVPNVVDHVADPPRLLAELRRCLAPGSPVWISSHVTHPTLAPLFRLLARARVGYFAGHPWAFTAAGLRRLVSQAGFRVDDEHTGEAVDSNEPPSPRSRAKRVALATRYLLARR